MCFHHSTRLYLGDGWKFLFKNTIIFFVKEMWRFASSKLFQGQGFTANTVLVKCSGVWPCHVPGRLCHALLPTGHLAFLWKAPSGVKAGLCCSHSCSWLTVEFHQCCSSGFVCYAAHHGSPVLTSQAVGGGEAPRKGRAGQTEAPLQFFQGKPYLPCFLWYWKLLPF